MAILFEEDEQGDLFIVSGELYVESELPVESLRGSALDDGAIWDAYVKACNVANAARRAVIEASRQIGNADLAPIRRRRAARQKKAQP